MSNRIPHELLSKIRNDIASLPGKSSYLKGKLLKIKTFITNQETKPIRDLICYEILTNNIFAHLLEYIVKDPNNKTVTLKSGEMLFHLFSTVSKGVNTISRNKWRDYKNKYNCFSHISTILSTFTADNEQEIQLYLKVYLRIIEWELQAQEPLDCSFHIGFLSTILEKHIKNDNMIQYILDIAVKLLQNERFKAFFTTNKYIMRKIPEDMGKEGYMCYHLIQLLIRISTHASKLDKNIMLALECLDYLLMIPENINLVRNENILLSISSFLKKYGNDLNIPNKMRSFLLQIINKDDLFILCEIIKKDSAQEITYKDLNYNILKELDDNLSEDSKETFQLMKQSAIDIIILLSKDKGFGYMLLDSNCLDSLIQSIKAALNNPDSNLPNLLILVEMILDLVKCYEDKTEDNQKLSNNILADIFTICSLSIINFDNDEKIVKDIIDLFQFKILNNPQVIDIIRLHPNNTYELFFLKLVNKYYMNNWLFKFLNKLPDTIIYPKENQIFPSLITKFEDELTKYSSQEKGEIISDIITIMNKITLILSLGLTFQQQTPFCTDNYYKLVTSLIKMNSLLLTKANKLFCLNENIHQYISLFYSALHNPNTKKIIETKKSIPSFLEKIITHFQSDPKVFLQIQMHLLFLTELNDKTMNKMLLENEDIIKFCKCCFALPVRNEELDEQNIKIVQLILKSLKDNNDLILFFMQENMFIDTIKIGINSNNKSIELMTTFFNVLHIIKEDYMTQLTKIYQNDITMQSYIRLIKSISFRTKIINEKCYSKVLNLFAEIIHTKPLNKEIIERNDLITYFVLEIKEVLTVKTNTIDSLIKVLYKILTSLFISIGEIIIMITPDLFHVINQTLNQMIKDDDKHIEVLFINIIQILTKINQNETEYHYFKETYRSIISAALMILEKKNTELNEDTLASFISLLDVWFKIENSTFIKPNENIFSIAYFKKLSLKFPRDNHLKKKSKNMLDNFIILIEKEMIKQHHIFEKYCKIETELLNLFQMNRRKRREGVNEKNKTIESSIQSYEPDEDNLVKINNRRRRTTINISSNPTLQNYFQMITTSLKQLIISADENIIRGDSIDNECEQMAKLTQLIKIFTKDEENTELLYEKNILNSLITILNNPKYHSFTKNEIYLLFFQAFDINFNHELFLHNDHACKYFINEINNIKDNFGAEEYELIYNRTAITTKIIALLSSDSSFVLKYSDVLDITKFIHIIDYIKIDNVVIEQLLIIMNNILLYNSKKSLVQLHRIADDFSELVLMKLKEKTVDDYRIVLMILKTIECIKDDPEIMKKFYEKDLKTFINDRLKENKVSTLTFNVMNLIDQLILNDLSLNLLIDKASISNMINATTYNIYDTKIIEKVLSIFCFISNKKYTLELSQSEAIMFYMTLLAKYMNTCQTDIIKTILNLINVLIVYPDDKNIVSKVDNMTILQKVYLYDIKKNPNLYEILLLLDNAMDFFHDSDNWDIILMNDMISQTMNTFYDNIPLFDLIIKIANSIFHKSQENKIKYNIHLCYLNAFDVYIKNNKIVALEKGIEKLNTIMIEGDSSFSDSNTNMLVFFDFFIIVLSSEGKCMTQVIFSNSLKIIYKVLKKNSEDIRYYENFTKLFSLCIQNVQFHTEKILVSLSQVTSILIKKQTLQESIFLLFFLRYLNKSHTESLSDLNYDKILRDIKDNALDYNIKSTEDCIEIGIHLSTLFTKNISNDRKLNDIIVIIIGLINHSPMIGYHLCQLQINFLEQISDYHNTYQKDNKRTILYYQVKACLHSLQSILQSENETKKNTEFLKRKETKKLMITAEMKKFLSESHNGTYYSSDKAEIKKNYVVEMSSDFHSILTYPKGQTQPEAIMYLKEMNSIVRSCTTPVFEKAKQRLKLFAKKPNPKRCFTIFGFKIYNQIQKSFNFECDKEEDCIKYVDYITSLLTNYKNDQNI